MREYLVNGHMSPIPTNEPKPAPSCYLPHHGVVKPDKTSTQLRVVFNPSIKRSIDSIKFF